MRDRFAAAIVLTSCLLGCAAEGESAAPPPPAAERPDPIDARLAKYVTVRLSADLTGVTDNEKKMIPILIEAAQAMDEAFWFQAWGNREALLETIDDPRVRRFVEINYGPWDRLAGNEPFVEDVGPKPAGAGFYPRDMTREEFEAAVAESQARARELKSLYTMIRRDGEGRLIAEPYRRYFSEQVKRAADKLRSAAALAGESALGRYLEARAKALLSDDYRPSDMAWMEMKDNAIDVVIGPVETYEDQLFGYKAAFTGYVLVKDRDWSRKLARYAELLGELQRGLPVPEAYKRETPGSDADLNAYDVVYYAGDCNAGSKTIAINLPNDEEVQLARGTRRLQLKNAMRAKFDEILLPIARKLIAPEQLSHVTFDAFFNNTMFHEVAHGLGIKRTLDRRSTVREALLEQASSVEEGKADVLGLYMVTRLQERGELEGGALEDHYVTFIASIFRSTRFGAASAHGRANLARFQFFAERGAFTRQADGTYRVDMGKMREAMEALSEKLLRLQGDGDLAGARAFMEERARLDPVLERDLAGLTEAGIPVDVVFEQGLGVYDRGGGSR